MANENETVEQACDDIAHIPWGVYTGKIETDDECGISQEYCNKLSERTLAAHKRELAAKDDEIARLKRENFDINCCLLAEQELAEKRDSLIKELSDALHLAASHTCYTSPVNVSKFLAIVDKAREVCK